MTEHYHGCQLAAVYIPQRIVSCAVGGIVAHFRGARFFLKKI